MLGYELSDMDYFSQFVDQFYRTFQSSLVFFFIKLGLFPRGHVNLHRLDKIIFINHGEWSFLGGGVWFGVV